MVTMMMMVGFAAEVIRVGHPRAGAHSSDANMKPFKLFIIMIVILNHHYDHRHHPGYHNDCPYHDDDSVGGDEISAVFGENTPVMSSPP